MLELLLSSSIFFGPDAHALRRTPEFRPSVFADRDGPIMPSEDVRPLLSGVFLSNFKPFESLSAVAYHYSTTVMFLIPSPHPSNAIGMIPHITHFAIRKELPRTNEVWKPIDMFLRILSTAAI